MAVTIVYTEFYKEDLSQKTSGDRISYNTYVSGNYLMKTGDTGTGDYTFDTNTLFIDSVHNCIGIRTLSPEGHSLTINASDGNCLRLIYNDEDSGPTTYADLSVTSDGYLSLDTSGGRISIPTDNMYIAAGGLSVGNENFAAGVVNVGTGFRIANAAASGAILRGNGTNFVSNGVAALTKTDDTNVTLTLGGTPTEALVTATSLTLGWTGQLAVSRGGTGIATTTAYSVICAGTTATGAFQSLAALGDVGQVLTSNGAGALPSFQASPSSKWTVSSGSNIYNTALGYVGVGMSATPLGYLDVQSSSASDVIAAFGCTAVVNAGYPGIIYISNVNTINSGYNINNNTGMYLNYVGYQNSTTQFRDLYVCDGKNNIVMFVDGSAGNVGIGTSAPSSKLSINGGLHVGGDSDAGDNNLLVDGSITGASCSTSGTITTGTGLNLRIGLGSTITIAAPYFVTANITFVLPTTYGTSGQVLQTDGSGVLSWGAGIAYPGAGIPISTGSAWGSSITDSHTNWDAAYTHSTDNSQAHTDYLINNGNDSTSGTLTATNFILSSDKRLKTKIKLLDVKYLDIDYKEFELKSEPNQKRFGVIAQDIIEKYPELIRTDEDGMLSVAYIDLMIREIVYLKQAVKQLKGKL